MPSEEVAPIMPEVHPESQEGQPDSEPGQNAYPDSLSGYGQTQ